MVNYEIRQAARNIPVSVYCLSTLFMLFLSIHAIQKWPGPWAQIAIFLACILPALVVIVRNGRDLIKEKWPVEINFVLVIVLLGALNVCFSEARGDSLKGMGLFLMSGLVVFTATFYLFDSKLAQKAFIFLCTICFVALVSYGIFDFVGNRGVPGHSISLFSSNPIPAGSLLILLSSGPLILLAQVKFSWGRKALWVCLFIGAATTILIGKRGPILAILVMIFAWRMTHSGRFWVFLAMGLALSGIGFQFRDQILSRVDSQALPALTVFARLELHRVAWQVASDKPLFGIGFNAPMSRYISRDYNPKWYPSDAVMPFSSVIGGVQVFDNMALCFLGQAGGLFTVVYIGFLAFLLRNLLAAMKRDLEIKDQGTMLLTVLAGFLAHSLTFDSLRFPDLNWIFHSLLGLMANYKKPICDV